MAGIWSNRLFRFAVFVAIIAKRRAVEVKADSYQQEFSINDQAPAMPWPQAGTLNQQRHITFKQLAQDMD
jgi:hypothetical protein